MLLIKPKQGRFCAEVLNKFRKKAKPEDSETEILTIWQARSGGIFFELDAKTKIKEAFCEVIRSILEEKTYVSTLELKWTLEIRDLNCLTVKDEVKEYLNRTFQTRVISTICLTTGNPRKQRIGERGSYCGPRRESNREASQTGKIVGWVYCRVPQRTMVPQCYTGAWVVSTYQL